MSDTQITPAKNFEERISDKIRETFAELVRQDELDAIVKKVIQDALYKERTIEVRDTYSSYSRSEKKASIVEECLDKFMRPEIAKCVDKWLADNPGVVINSINTAVTKGVASCVFAEIERRFGESTHALLNEVGQIRNALSAKGIGI